MLQDVVEWRKTAFKPIADDEAVKLCNRELWSIQTVMPTMLSPEHIISATAAFIWTLILDDLAETLTPEGALANLRSAQELVRSWKSPLKKCRVLQRPTKAIRLARNATGTLLEFLQNYMPPAQLSAFFSTLLTVLIDLEEEQHVRQSPHPSTQSYLKARAKSMCMPPFMFLLQAERMTQAPKVSSQDLQKLQKLLFQLVGLQNDLLGLPRDISKNDPMNYIIISAKESGLSSQATADLKQLDRFVGEAVTLHNQLSWEAEKLFAHIQQTGNAEDIMFAESIMVFVETHACWMAACRRFTVEGDPECW